MPFSVETSNNIIEKQPFRLKRAQVTVKRAQIYG